ncbi:MAG: sulfatase-like hydrolase/transferase [Acidobacteria bacterium]|nr:sulfatase-like hydrolase/transferase [Acidobacteriota bacterium]
MSQDLRISRRAALAGGTGALLARGMAGRRPNVILFLTDDMGCRDLGICGASDLKTPHIDSLGRGGVVFDNWYSNAPVCAPARAALMTGRIPLRAGVGTNGKDLRPSEKSIASLLQPAGYSTALTGKWHLGATAETDPNAHGFDYYYGFHGGCVDYYSHRYYWGEPKTVNQHDLWRNRQEIFEDGQYLTNRIADEAVSFVERQKSQPFFLYTALNAVHYPMHAPRRYVERFPGMEPERQMYAAMLAAADDAVGRILEAVDKTGQRENTLIFFLGDNGATTERRAGLKQKPATAGRNGVFRGYKFSVFDGGMHVPGIMNWPGVIPAGQTRKQVVMTADVLPTICVAAGVDVPADRTLDGRNILGVAKDGAASPHEALFWENNQQLAVRQGPWKLVIDGRDYDTTADGWKPLTGEDALFLSNLEEDPGERRNRRREFPKLVDELATMVHRWRETAERE